MNIERKEKRGPWLELLLIGSIVLLVGLIIFITLNSGNSKFQNLLSGKYNSTIEVNNTEFHNIKMITETSNDPSISFSFKYPETSFETLNNEIKQFINQSRETYISDVRNNESNKGHLNINTTIYPYKENYYSIVISKVVTYDFSKYDMEYHTYFFEKETGNIISLKNILQDDVSHFTLLSSFVQNNLLHSKELKDKIDNEVIINFTNPTWENYSNFALTNDQLIMYFNLDDEASEKKITSSVKVNVSYLNPILKTDFQSKEKSESNIVLDQKKKQNKHRKLVALTFDDGPHEKITRQILNTLDKYDAKATFFVIGTQVKKNKDVLQEIKDKGHEIGNHTFNHKKLTKLNTKQIEYEVNTTSQLIKDVIGEEPTVMRPPYGSTNKQINNMINVPVVLWTVDTLDWKYRNANKLLPVVKNNVHNNGIILMHDIHQSTADGLESVLKYLHGEGYEFVTVSEILSLK